MTDVVIRSSDKTETGFVFEVDVAEAGRQSQHTVHLTQRDYEDWAGTDATPAAVVARCLELLAERVKQDDLMDVFDLREALQLYPAFEEEVRRRLV